MTLGFMLCYSLSVMDECILMAFYQLHFGIFSIRHSKKNLVTVIYGIGVKEYDMEIV
jgi:hypothetical protein